MRTRFAGAARERFARRVEILICFYINPNGDNPPPYRADAAAQGLEKGNVGGYRNARRVPAVALLDGGRQYARTSLLLLLLLSSFRSSKCILRGNNTRLIIERERIARSRYSRFVQPPSS